MNWWLRKQKTDTEERHSVHCRVRLGYDDALWKAINVCGCAFENNKCLWIPRNDLKKKLFDGTRTLLPVGDIQGLQKEQMRDLHLLSMRCYDYTRVMTKVDACIAL